MGFFSGIVGGITNLFSANEEKEAAQDQFNAIQRGREGINKAGKELGEFYNPFTTAAQPAYQKIYDLILGGDYSQYRQSPGYQYAQDEAMKQVMRSASTRGGVVSGQTFKELQERGKNLADLDFQNYIGSLSKLFDTSFNIGEASKKLPITLAQQDLGLDLSGQEVMGQGNITRTNKVGAGIGQIGGAIEDSSQNSLMSLFTGGMGNLSGFQYGLGGTGGIPTGSFAKATGVINPYSYGA